MSNTRKLWWAELILIACVPLLTLLLTLLYTNPKFIGIWEDDYIYLTSAASLAHGEGYISKALPGAPALAKYPPLYPCLLSISMRAGLDHTNNTSLWIILWFHCLLLSGTACLFVNCLLNKLGCSISERWAAFMLLVINSTVLNTAVATMSEGLFLLLFMGQLICLLQISNYPVLTSPQEISPNSDSILVKKIRLFSLMLFLTTLLGCLTRTINNFIALGYVVVLIWRKRWTMAASLVLVMLVCCCVSSHLRNKALEKNIAEIPELVPILGYYLDYDYHINYYRHYKNEPEGLRRERLAALVLRANLEQAMQSGARRNLNASSLRSGGYKRTNEGSRIIQVRGALCALTEVAWANMRNGVWSLGDVFYPVKSLGADSLLPSGSNQAGACRVTVVIVTLIILLLTIVGLVATKSHWPLLITLSFYVGVFIVWPWPFSVRFWIPAMPIIIAGFIFGCRKLKRSGPLVLWAITILAVMMHMVLIGVRFESRKTVHVKEYPEMTEYERLALAHENHMRWLKEASSSGNAIVLLGGFDTMWTARQAGIQGLRLNTLLEPDYFLPKFVGIDTSKTFSIQQIQEMLWQKLLSLRANLPPETRLLIQSDNNLTRDLREILKLYESRGLIHKTGPKENIFYQIYEIPTLSQSRSQSGFSSVSA